MSNVQSRLRQPSIYVVKLRNNALIVDLPRNYDLYNLFSLWSVFVMYSYVTSLGFLPRSWPIGLEGVRSPPPPLISATAPGYFVTASFAWIHQQDPRPGTNLDIWWGCPLLGNALRSRQCHCRIISTSNYQEDDDEYSLLVTDGIWPKTRLAAILNSCTFDL